MNTTPALNAETRTPLQALRDLMDQAEKLARHIGDGAPDLAITGHMEDFVDQLPFDALTEAEQAKTRYDEDRETEAYYSDRRLEAHLAPKVL